MVFVRATPGALQPAKVAVCTVRLGGAILSSHLSPLCTPSHVARTRCRPPGLLGKIRVPNSCAVDHCPTRLRSCVAGLLIAAHYYRAPPRYKSDLERPPFDKTKTETVRPGCHTTAAAVAVGGDVWVPTWVPTAARVPVCAVVSRRAAVVMCSSWAMSHC